MLLLLACAKETPKEEGTPPEGTLTFDSPEAGAWTDIGAQPGEGTATNVESVSVGGTNLTPGAEGAWSTSLDLARGINTLEATAVDLRGDTLFVRHAVLAGTFEDPDDAVEGALEVRVNRSGLARIGDLAEGLVTAELVNDALGGLNPVMEEELLGIDFTANLDYVGFGAPSLVFEPSAATVGLSASLPDLDVDATVYADAGWVGSTDFGLGMTASAAVVTASFVVDAADGELGLTLVDSSVALQDFAYTLSFVPEWITDYAFVDTIRGTVESMLVDQITTMVPPLVEDTLAGLDPSFSTDLMGRNVTLAFAFADAGSDDEGLHLTLDLDVDFPSSGDHAYVGYLTAPYGEPEVDTSADVAAAASDDLLNLVLFEAWRSGILELRMSTDDGSLEPALLSQFHAEEGTITTWAELPPVIVERDGALLAQVGELLVTVDTPGGELGEHLVVAVSGEVPLDVALDDGELVLDIGTPALTMMVRESDWGADNDTVTRLIEEALPLESLLALLGNLSFPLPELYGLSFATGDATRDEDGVHTDIRVFLQ